MSGKKHFGLFGYLTIDHKAAQEYLNGMADNGWRLVGIWGGILSVFEETPRRDLCYFVDLADPKFKEDPDYLSLCADAGWEEVCVVRYMRIYAALPGSSPVPIQTDGGVEYLRFRQLVLRHMLIGAGVTLAALLLLAFTIFTVSGSPWSHTCTLFVRSYFIGVTFFSLPLALPPLLCYLALLFTRLRVWQGLRETGEPVPVPHRRAARARGLLTLLAYFWAVLLFLALAVDSGLNGLSFGTLLGLLLGSLFYDGIARVQNWRRRFSKWYTNPFLYAGLLVLALYLFSSSAGGAARRGAPPAPIAGDPFSYKSEQSFLGRYDTWWEDLTLSTTRHDLSIAHYTCQFDWLADGIAGGYPDARPVEGIEGALWFTRPKERFLWRSGLLLRHGKTVLVLYMDEALLDDPQLISALANWQG